MAIREIVQHTDPFIRKKSRPVTEINESIRAILDDMKETVISCNGSGLAAVQVGILKRMFVLNINGMYIEFINPTILKTSGEQHNPEGCLSVKMPYAYVKRPLFVEVSAFDRYGNKFTLNCTDYTAICVMHEYDHLDGVLYIDKAEKYLTKQEMKEQCE